MTSPHSIALLVVLAACTRTPETSPPMSQPPAAHPPAATQPLALSVTVGDGPGVVVLELTNRGATPLSVLSHVEAARTLLPWYSVELTGAGAPRRLVLGGAANEAAAISVELKPGGSLSHPVDLQRAALDAHNGATRLAPGTYQVKATYAVSEAGTHWTGSIASAPLRVTLP